MGEFVNGEGGGRGERGWNPSCEILPVRPECRYKMNDEQKEEKDKRKIYRTVWREEGWIGYKGVNEGNKG